MSGPVLTDLPEPARTRVVAMAAEVLPDVPRLPPAVRRVAGFAPSRRARLGGTAITEALADDEVRERIGVQVAARSAPDAADPADAAGAAARAWLTRPEGWEDVLEEAVRRLAEAAASATGTDRETERLQARLAEAEQAVRELRTSSRAQVDELKAENAALRRKLGETRTSERAARAEAESAAGALAAERAAGETRLAAAQKENRQLRAQVERQETQAAQGRREARIERDETTLRARLLLETVIDAATGLRRELALPTLSGAPGDRVEADVAAPGRRVPVQAGLEQYLAMPRSRLIIDGYNVSKAAWASSSLEAQRIRLVTALAPLVARTGAETTVVFDAAETDHRPPVSAPRGVKVLYSPRGVIADDVIRDLVAAEPEGRVVMVVTADQEIARDVTRDAARVVPPESLLEMLAR